MAPLHLLWVSTPFRVHRGFLVLQFARTAAVCSTSNTSASSSRREKLQAAETELQEPVDVCEIAQATTEVTQKYMRLEIIF